jgi:hypothetical protein
VQAREEQDTGTQEAIAMRFLRRASRQILRCAEARRRPRQDPLLACDELCRQVAIARVRYFNLVGDSSNG